MYFGPLTISEGTILRRQWEGDQQHDTQTGRAAEIATCHNKVSGLVSLYLETIRRMLQWYAKKKKNLFFSRCGIPSSGWKAENRKAKENRN